MRIAVLADVHGNLPALDAVIAELDRLEPDHVVMNGDLINAVPFSAGVIDRVRESNWIVIRGNHEFYYLDFGTERATPGTEDPARWGQLHWLLGQITPDQGEYLAVLPDDRTLYLPGTLPLRITHGVPGRNRVGFYNEQPAESIATEILHVRESTLVSAHTHVQVDRHIHVGTDHDGDLFSDPHSSVDAMAHEPARHWHVINPGSVGLPLNGDPTAQFVVLESVPVEIEPGGWQATHHRVPYDRRPALAGYAETGMMEAGGVITQLFYWELVTGSPEIIHFYHWARDNGHDDEHGIEDAFAAYQAATGRDQHVRSLDPLEIGGW